MSSGTSCTTHTALRNRVFPVKKKDEKMLLPLFAVLRQKDLTFLYFFFFLVTKPAEADWLSRKWKGEEEGEGGADFIVTAI